MHELRVYQVDLLGQPIDFVKRDVDARRGQVVVGCGLNVQPQSYRTNKNKRLEQTEIPQALVVDPNYVLTSYNSNNLTGLAYCPSSSLVHQIKRSGIVAS